MSTDSFLQRDDRERQLGLEQVVSREHTGVCDGSQSKRRHPVSSAPESRVKLHANNSQNVKALVSLGGWTGSLFFSTSVGSAENRTAFVNTITQLVDEYDLDGVDFEYVLPSYCPPVLSSELRELTQTTAGSTPTGKASAATPSTPTTRPTSSRFSKSSAPRPTAPTSTSPPPPPSSPGTTRPAPSRPTSPASRRCSTTSCS